jgi:hypothetical protein
MQFVTARGRGVSHITTYIRMELPSPERASSGGYLGVLLVKGQELDLATVTNSPVKPKSYSEVDSRYCTVDHIGLDFGLCRE